MIFFRKNVNEMIKFNNMWKNMKDCKKNKRNIKELNYYDIDLKEYMVIDVRSRREFKEIHLNSSINIPLSEVKSNIKKYVNDKNKKLLICCQSGIRSAKAVKILESMGYVQVYNLKGGIENI